MTTALVRALTVACATGAGLMAGVFGAFSVMVMPALRSRPASEATAAMQAINQAAPAPPFVAVLLGTALGCVVLVVVAVVDLREPAARWALGGAALYLASLAVTIVHHIPRNDALARVDAASPEAVAGWTRYLAEWVPANHARGIAAAAGAVLMTMSLLHGR